MEKTEIMIVEDDWIVAEDIKNSLQNMGYLVTDIKHSGEDAIKAIEENAPDLVLMDIMLKGEMDGIEVAARIRDRFNLPVVYLTAYTNGDLRERAKITEPLGYIVKPFEERELNTIVEIALYRHKMDRKLRESEEKYSALVEQAHDGVIIAQDEKIKFVNKAITTISGYSAEELKEMHFLDFIADGSKKKVVHSYEQRIAGKKELCPFHFELICKDGTIKDMELSANRFTYEGRPAAMAIIRDISKRVTT